MFDNGTPMELLEERSFCALARSSKSFVSNRSELAMLQFEMISLYCETDS